jgi:hypothetical protein
MTTQFYLRDPQGNLLTIFQNLVRAEYARGENKTGYMYLDFDPSSIDATLFRLDARIEPWRTIGGLAPYLDGETVFFVRKWGWSMDASGREIFRIYAEDANYLLDSRIVAYDSTSAYANSDSTDQGDDLMKGLVRQSLGVDATDTARRINTWLTVAADLSLAPGITKAFARNLISTVLNEIAAESFQQGTYLVYDIVYTGPTTLEFRTYTTQRGNNHGRTSGQTVVISRERKNFEEPSFVEDHENEITYVYAGGQDTGANREVLTATNTVAVGQSPFNRRELWVDARAVDNPDKTKMTAAIQSEANAALQENRARKTLTGRIIDTEGCQDGVHYRYGDIVYAEYRGQGYDAHINMLHVTIEGGRETRENQIRAEA